MFKSGLLATTAFVVVGSLSFAATQISARAANTGATQDRNREFLCTYGQFDVSSYSSWPSSSILRGWTHVAVPIVGRGKTVDRIIVREGSGGHKDGGEFSAGIYSNSPSGLPGRLIAGGTGRPSKHCGHAQVSIAPTRLKWNKAYWVEERVPLQGSKVDDYWAINPRAANKAYEQSYYYYYSDSGHSYSSTSPWTQQSAGPWVNLR
jgi:hypothetical protein